uniref:Uncharacterized protein n=1 Tax=Rhizophora mucronata TaxID=61149 RepID=A0A2P2IN18_RHIMU
MGFICCQSNSSPPNVDKRST